MIAEDWVVSIYGKKLINNVSAMSVLLNSIGQELNAPVAVELLPHQIGSDEPLHRILERQAKRDRNIGYIKCGATIVLGAVVGALFQWLFLGGRLQ